MLRKIIPLSRTGALSVYSNDPVYQSNVHLFSSVATAGEGVQNALPISKMPGLKRYPLVGSIFSFITRKDFNPNKMHLVWDGIIEDYGPIVSMYAPGTPPTVIVTRPEDIEAMYRATMDNPIRDSFQSLKKVRDEAVDNYFEKKGGILAENNEEWWRVRSRVQTPMMRPKNVVRFLTQMDEISLQFMDRIAIFQRDLGEMPETFLQEMYKWALESVGAVALNRRLGCLDPDLPTDSTQVQLIQTVNNIFGYLHITEMHFHWWAYIPSPTMKKFKAGHELFTRIVHKHILETEAELKSKIAIEGENIQDLSLLEILLQRDGLTRKDVVTIILDMFFAGIDTTSHTLAFTLYLLAKNPLAQRRLQEELDSVLGDGEKPITEAQLARLSYLKTCIKESMRLMPLVPGSARVLTNDTVIGGYLIPKGYQIFAANCVTAKSEKVFKRAKEFLPERWSRDHSLGPINSYGSLPFSHGTRMCIGRRIAEQEMYTFLARAFHRFNVSYKYKDIDMITRLVNVPSEPLKFEFTERKR